MVKHVMDVLLIGSGGREHALAWALRRSPRLGRFCIAPGNAGIAHEGELVDISPTDVDGIVEHATSNGYELVVVGPEAPLVDGLADRLQGAGIPVFGASARAAELEGSKVFAKRFMSRHGIPTAAFEIFRDLDSARQYLESVERTYPLVIKADGLAAGKGVLIVDEARTAVEVAEGMLSGRSFGEAGRRIVVEERLVGREASFFVLSDGRDFVELATCQDYKRALDGDGGLNTGGMGTYSPSVFLDETARREIVDSIVRPTIDGLADDERPYRGVLYVGVMITETGPKVLEYNARFGDPETQVMMPRLDGDWLEVLHACATGSLPGSALRWKSEAAVCVVMTSGGYPGSYAKGAPIDGLDRAGGLGGVIVFHAGTSRDASGRVVTSGGRVLGVTALGKDLAAARRQAYAAVDVIRWEGEHHRLDIAEDAVTRQAQS
jgi:phosphoribosylamine--glycine ligase